MKEKDTDMKQEFGQKLKSRMNELSDSVDCFSRISDRVFHEEDADYTDSEFVVTDLENITGRRRFSPLIKVAAAGLAAVLAICVVPRTAFYRRIMCSIGEHEDTTFNTAVSSVMSATDKESDMEFHIYDVGLEEYIRDDVLVTPLYSCPFEDIGRDNVRVRVFVRTYNDILTNEIYAVEYSGDYKESNFIAVADTRPRFTEEELEKAYEGVLQLQRIGALSSGPYTLDSESISLSFMQYSIFKASDGVYPMESFVKYRLSSPETYEYSIYSETPLNGQTTQSYSFEPRDVRWERSVYADGTSALPTENASSFTRAEAASPIDSEVMYTPYNDIDITGEVTKINTVTLMPTGITFGLPADWASLRTFIINIPTAAEIHDALGQAVSSEDAEPTEPYCYIESDEPSLAAELGNEKAIRQVITNETVTEAHVTVTEEKIIQQEKAEAEERSRAEAEAAAKRAREAEQQAHKAEAEERARAEAEAAAKRAREAEQQAHEVIVQDDGLSTLVVSTD